MSKRSIIAALALLVCASATTVAAKPKATTMKVVGGTGKVLVNGAAYVAGSTLPKNAKVEIVGGDATIEMGELTVQAPAGTKLQVSGGQLRVMAGSVVVRTPDGKTRKAAAGARLALIAEPQATPLDTPVTTAELPGPNPQQDQAVSPVSPVSPSSP